MTFFLGCEYTGERNSRDQPHGQGTMTEDNGDKYTGEWKDGERVP